MYCALNISMNYALMLEKLNFYAHFPSQTLAFCSRRSLYTNFFGGDFCRELSGHIGAIYFALDIFIYQIILAKQALVMRTLIDGHV